MTTEVTACLVAVRRTVPDDRCTASIDPDVWNNDKRFGVAFD